MYELNEKLASRVLEIVDVGLVKGKGKPVPGQLCVEAAVCLAMGLPHSDEPTCVGSSVRAFKIRLNDSAWSSDKARAQGMRKLAVAQLGSDTIDQKAFRQIVVEQTIRQILPIALRAAASRNPKHSERLEAAAVRCEKDGNQAAAKAAQNAASEARRAADASADAYAYASADADAAADAAAAAAAAAYAAAAAAAAAGAATDASTRDRVLADFAERVVQILVEMGAPGAQWLDLSPLGAV